LPSYVAGVEPGCRKHELAESAEWNDNLALGSRTRTDLGWMQKQEWAHRTMDHSPQRLSRKIWCIEPHRDARYAFPYEGVEHLGANRMNSVREKSPSPKMSTARRNSGKRRELPNTKSERTCRRLVVRLLSDQAAKRQRRQNARRHGPLQNPVSHRAVTGATMAPSVSILRSKPNARPKSIGPDATGPESLSPGSTNATTKPIVRTRDQDV